MLLIECKNLKGGGILRIKFEKEAVKHISKTDKPMPDEVEASEKANKSIDENAEKLEFVARRWL